MREQLGYAKMDACIYQTNVFQQMEKNRYNDPWPIERQQDEHLISFLTRQVFLLGFSETNKRVGDTRSLFEVEKEAFFNDNVPRFIDHDELHLRVAKLYGHDRPYYERFQSGNNVELNKELFLAEPLETQIQTGHEEITVLLLERKVIPELMSVSKDGYIFDANDIMTKRERNLKELIVHFITNLCGNGHYWLRRFYIDHYDMMTNWDCFMKVFDVIKIEELGMEITGVKVFDAPKRETFETFCVYAKQNPKFEHSISESVGRYCLNNTFVTVQQLLNYNEHNEAWKNLAEMCVGVFEHVKPKPEDTKMKKNNGWTLVQRPKRKPKKSSTKAVTLKKVLKPNTLKQLETFVELFDPNEQIYINSGMFGKSPHKIYVDSKSGLGFVDEGDGKILLFYFCLKNDGNHLKVCGKSFRPSESDGVSPEPIDAKYDIDLHYYHSYCTDYDDPMEKYMSSYGRGPKSLEGFFETMAHNLICFGDVKQ
jgi:hypothetical protein